MRILVQVREVYGVRKVYPLCAKAKAFARIAGTTTLTHAALIQIEALGFTIECANPAPNWKDAA